MSSDCATSDSQARAETVLFVARGNNDRQFDQFRRLGLVEDSASTGGHASAARRGSDERPRTGFQVASGLTVRPCFDSSLPTTLRPSAPYYKDVRSPGFHALGSSWLPWSLAPAATAERIRAQRRQGRARFHRLRRRSLRSISRAIAAKWCC